MTTLWGGWIVECFESSGEGEGKGEGEEDHLAGFGVGEGTTRKSCVYFAGDTGYRNAPGSEEVCPAFAGESSSLAPPLYFFSGGVVLRIIRFGNLLILLNEFSQQKLESGLVLSTFL